MRRLFIYIERSIDEGIQWAVFEPIKRAVAVGEGDTAGQTLRLVGVHT